MEAKTTITINFSVEHLKQVVAEYVNKNYPYDVTPDDVSFIAGSHTEGYGMGEHSVVRLDGCKVNVTQPKAYWRYWGGWKGNHDKRIEDATCSKCGYVHPTVRGSIDLLADVCPKCHSLMDKKFGEDK